MGEARIDRMGRPLVGLAVHPEMRAKGPLKERRKVVMSEKELMDAVTDMAEVYGWSWAHFRPAKTSKGWRTPVSGPMGEGFPDLVLVRQRDRRILFAELKREGALRTYEQVQVAHLLEGWYRLWTPVDLDSGAIQVVLA